MLTPGKKTPVTGRPGAGPGTGPGGGGDGEKSPPEGPKKREKRPPALDVGAGVSYV